MEKDAHEPDISLHPYDPKTESRQIRSLLDDRERRDNALVKKLLGKLADQAHEPSINLVPLTIDLVKARASMGEIVERLKECWGTYRENPVV